MLYIFRIELENISKYGKNVNLYENNMIRIQINVSMCEQQFLFFMLLEYFS